MLLFVLHQFYTFHCLEISLYRVFIFIVIFFFVFMIPVLTMDHNAEYLRLIGHVREISYAWRDECHRSLLTSLITIVDTINILNDALYSIASYTERKIQEYVDGLRQNEIQMLKITKEHIYTLFRVPQIDEIEREVDHIIPLTTYFH